MIFVKEMKEREQIRLFDVVYLVVPQEVTDVISVDYIGTGVCGSSFYSFESSIRFKIALAPQLLSLFLYYSFIFRNRF